MTFNLKKITAGALVSLPIAAFALTGAAGTFANVALAGYGQEKVQVCHKGHTLTIAAPAVPAHLKQGDTLGTCPA